MFLCVWVCLSYHGNGRKILGFIGPRNPTLSHSWWGFRRWAQVVSQTPKAESKTLGLIWIYDILTCSQEPEYFSLVGSLQEESYRALFLTSIEIKNQESKRWILMLTYFIFPRASHQGWGIAVQTVGYLQKGLVGIFVDLNRTEGMLIMANTARPDIYLI